MDLDGDGRAETIGEAVTLRSYGGRRLSAFFIAGTVDDQYKILYKLVGNFKITGESLIDFNGDHVQDYTFRYGRDDRDFGYVLLWNQPGSVKAVYRKKFPYSFYLEDLDQDGLSEIIQVAGPIAGPRDKGPVPDWQWMDVYRWDAPTTTFVLDNARYPSFFGNRRLKFEDLLGQIEAQNVPGFDWSGNEKDFLALKQRIETDYLKRISLLTGPP